jgi:uncharacterized protein YjbI with pentapeptide repeats
MCARSSAIVRGGAGRPAWWTLLLVVGLGLVSLPALSANAGESSRRPTIARQGADDRQTQLEIDKLREEIKNLQSERSPWRTIPQYAAVLTAFVALLGFLLTARTSIRQREAESLRRFDERFDDAVTKLASDRPVLQVSAAAALASFSRPEYRRFHEQAFMVALSNLKIEQSQEVQRLLMRAFELVARELLPKAGTDAAVGKDVLIATLGLDLTHAHLDRINLSGLDLRGVDIAFSELNHASLRGTNLYRARGIQVRLNRATLTDANLGEARFREAFSQGAHFHRARLSSARLEGADLRLAQFQGAMLQAAHLDGADLTGANFVDANLNQTFFKGATLDDRALGTLAKAKHLADAHFDKDTLDRMESLGLAAARREERS